jgi:hypothetical protein
MSATDKKADGDLRATSIEAESAGRRSPSAVGLWIGVGVVFGLLVLAWTAMFFFANKHRPADVPLETREVR